MLQWSCNFIVTEIPKYTPIDTALSELQWSCNFIVTEIWYSLAVLLNALSRFNGAVTLSLQKSGADSHILSDRRGDRFNGAVTLSLQKLVTTSILISTSPSFNGAVTLSLQK